MQIETASKADDRKINTFFQGMPIEGAIRYQIERPMGFSTHAAQEFIEQHSLQLKDEEQIHACLSLNVKNAWVNSLEKIAWATDLRISNNRKAILYWFDHFMEEIQKIRQTHGISHVFSFINKTNMSAFNTFIRPRTLRPHHPRFHLLTNFFRLSIYSRIPLLYRPLRSLRIKSLDDSNIEALAKYLAKKNENRIMASEYNVELLERRLASWHNFNKENFLIAYDAKGNIVGCVAPWNTRMTQRYKIIGYNDFYDNMRQISKFTSLLGLSDPMPKPGHFADFYYLTHLRADNTYIFHRLLHEALEFCGDNQYIVYSSFEGDRTYKPPRDTIYSKNKFGLYLVLDPSEDLPFTHLSSEAIPDFEIAFL